MQEVLHLSFDIPCPSHILWWAICVAFIGSLITGVLMRQASRFTLTDSGQPVSLQKFHRVGSGKKAKEVLSSMSVNSRRSMRIGLNIDFLFMPFFYGLMVCLSILVYRNASEYSAWSDILYALCWLPFGLWLFDLVENSATISLLKSFDKKGEATGGKAVLMTAGSLLKWLSGLAWLLLMISHAVTRIVEHWQ